MGSAGSKQQAISRKEKPSAKPTCVNSRGVLGNSHLADPPGTPGFASADFVGLIKVTVDQAFMRKKGHYNVTLSLGLQVRNLPSA